MDSDKKKARTIKASRLLQAKVGVGPLVDEKLITRSQKLIDGNEVDFAPMAQEYLSLLQTAIDEAKKPGRDDKIVLDELVNAVMQIKANATMFDYDLMGGLANVMLNFLETLEAIDNDVIDIVEAHQKTQQMVIGNKMKGGGGEFGRTVTAELKDACKRYFAKKASAGNAIKDTDAFFVDG